MSSIRKIVITLCVLYGIFAILYAPYLRWIAAPQVTDEINNLPHYQAVNATADYLECPVNMTYVYSDVVYRTSVENVCNKTRFVIYVNLLDPSQFELVRPDIPLKWEYWRIIGISYGLGISGGIVLGLFTFALLREYFLVTQNKDNFEFASPHNSI